MDVFDAKEIRSVALTHSSAGVVLVTTRLCASSIVVAARNTFGAAGLSATGVILRLIVVSTA